MKLNLGSGSSKFEGFTNIDCDASCEPDIICDFTKGLPFETESIDAVVMFHTIEHIQKIKHLGIFLEVRRVLKLDGYFNLSFPEFKYCAQNWIDNHKGMRDFWEMTLFGRQTSPSDYHVCAMDSDQTVYTLKQAGFQLCRVSSEFPETHNTVIKVKPDILQTYAMSVKETIWTEPRSETKSLET